MTRCFSLLADDSFVVRVAGELLPLVDDWLPLHRRSIAAVAAVAAPRTACIDVVQGAAAEADDGGEAPAVLLRLGTVTARVLAPGDIALRGDGACGIVALATQSARITVAGVVATGAIAATLASMLTLSSALLLGRLGAALVHAGGVVDPDGRAWLLAGDTHAGKTTTCVALADVGWRLLADDQVVLRAGAGGEIVAEGWPRRAHLDAGYGWAAVTGHRVPVDLRERWDGRWCQLAPVHATLLPRVQAQAPTAARRVTAAGAFAALVRQSPWLLADGVAAPGIAALLRAVALRPSFALHLGRDSYGDGALLDRLLRPAPLV